MASNYIIEPGGKLTGMMTVPGDKSISHRAIMLSAIAEGTCHISGFLEGQDALATIAALRSMGVAIEGPAQGKVIVHGVGLHGLKEPQNVLDCGNSGTTIRLLSGLLAAQTFKVNLTGDSSLCKRPMQRVMIPLQQMGAKITASATHTPPLTIQGNPNLQAIIYELPIASAQVKSAILLAGLYAQGKTTVIEPLPSRDHTERMLQSFAYPVTREENKISLSGPSKLIATDIQIPADISSAAFFMVGASIIPGSDITLMQVGVNPTRTGVIDILRLMGADIEIKNQRFFGAEPVADIRVKYSPLQGIIIPSYLVPLAIDEFPVIFIAAANANGDTLLTEAEELRVKESDRINVMATGLQQLGIKADALADGIRITGGKYSGGNIDSHGDHRIAMAFAMAACNASSLIEITDCDNVATSFPNFTALAKQHGLNIKSIASIQKNS